MIQYLSLILSFIFLFLAGNGKPVESSLGHDGQEVKECCQQETAEESTPDCCRQESQEEKDCCKQEKQEEKDCCKQETGEENTPDCCKQESTKVTLPENIPDCCGN